MWLNKWRCAAVCRKFLRFQIGGTQLFGDIDCGLLLFFGYPVVVSFLHELELCSERVIVQFQLLILIVGEMAQLLTDFVPPIGPLLSQVVAE